MKIALIEKKERIKVKDFDKIISFCSRDDYINVDSYITKNEIDKIYDSVYNALCNSLNSHRDKKTFFIGDVDILQAYGKQVFDFLVRLCQKKAALKKIIEKESPKEIWISNNTDYAAICPFFDFFIKDFIPSNITLKYFSNNKLCLQKQVYFTNQKTKKEIIINHILHSIYRVIDLFCSKCNDNILIYSDYEQITKLNDFTKKRIIIIRDNFPRRLFFTLLNKKICLKLFSDFNVLVGNIEKNTKDLIGQLESTPLLICVNNADYSKYVKKYLKTRWQAELLKVIPRIFQSHALFSKIPITSLLVDQDRGIYHNILVQVANNYNCLTYVNLHGDPFHRIGFLPLTADYIFVWGAQQKELFENWGLHSDRIVVTGCSKYDKYIKTPSDLLKKRICKELGLSYKEPICVIATFPLVYRSNILENTIREQIKKIICTVSDFKNIQILIKLHPGDDNESRIHNLVKNLDADIKIIKNYDALLLAKGVDMLVVYSSTFAIDGLVYAKPVVLVDHESVKKYKNLDYFYDGTDVGKIKNSLSGILNGQHKKHIINYQTAMDKYLNGGNAQASQNIAKHIGK